MTQLTRALYPKDEVELSLLLALLKRRPLQECLFWVAELVYSGFDVTQLLLSIYFDFYAQLNPDLLGKLVVVLRDLVTRGDVEGIVKIIKAMRSRRSTDNVFSLRLAEPITKIKIYRGRVPNWLSAYEPRMRPFARGVKEVDWVQILKALELRHSEPRVFAEVADSVLRSCGKRSVQNDMEICGGVYNDEYHIVLAMLVRGFTEDSSLVKKRVMIKPTRDELDFIEQLNRTYALDVRERYDSGYDVSLFHQRRYPIDPDVNAFQTNRCAMGVSVAEFVSDIAMKWAVYCSETPFWQHVFRRANATGVSDTGELVFASGDQDDQIELFSGQYEYLFCLDEPYMRGLWDVTCPVITSSVGKDVVDLLEEIYGQDDDGMRMDFGDIELSNERVQYPKVWIPMLDDLNMTEDGEVGEDKKETCVFDFSRLNKILDSI